MYLYVEKYICGINSGCLWPTVGRNRHRRKKRKVKWTLLWAVLWKMGINGQFLGVVSDSDFFNKSRQLILPDSQ